MSLIIYENQSFCSLKQDQVLWDPWKPSKPFKLPISIPPPRRKASIKIRWHPFIHLGGDKLCSQISCLRSLHDADTWFEPQGHSHMERVGDAPRLFYGCKLRILVLLRFPGQKAKIFGLQGIIYGPREEIKTTGDNAS